MNSQLKLQDLSPEELRKYHYDLVICALGYESRAVAVAGNISENAKRKKAFGFDHNPAVAYACNEKWFRDHDYEIAPRLGQSEFGAELRKSVEETLSVGAQKRTMRIAVDISCFDRYRIAEIVSLFRTLNLSQEVHVDFWYCIAEFEAPAAVAGRNEVAGPVHSRFAGRFIDPGRPLALIAGLGYELGKVMGAAEYVQASRVIALFPLSPIKPYESEVAKANHLLLDDLKSTDVVRYSVDSPLRTVATLDALVRGLQDSHNVVLLPGGPKIFVLAALLAQTLHPETSVWRVSSGASIKPKDVRASSHFVGLQWVLGNVPLDLSHR